MGKIMDLLFRELNIEDKEEIVDLFIETYKKEPWNENWDKEIACAKISNLLMNSSAINYCVTNNENKIIGVLLGYSNYFIDKKEYYVDEFFIDLNYHRKGIGKKFMDYVEENIKQNGHTCIVLLTKKSFPSEYFYKNIGFNTSPYMILMYKDIRNLN
jgi:N-acetylglutamate synthase-like GNAT family acetyltransferase